MRKGVLVIRPFKYPQEGEMFFDKNNLEYLVWVGSQRQIQARKREPHRFCRLFIEDELDQKSYCFADSKQAKYIYKYVTQDEGEKKPFHFFTLDDHVLLVKKAVIFAKNTGMMHNINQIAPIANEYGKYVAGQKAINEPSKEFSLWYFEISI